MCWVWKKNMFGDVTLRIPTDWIKQQKETTRPRDDFTTSLFLLSCFTFVCLPALPRVFSLWRLPFCHQLGFCDLITGWDKKTQGRKTGQSDVAGLFVPPLCLFHVRLFTDAAKPCDVVTLEPRKKTENWFHMLPASGSVSGSKPLTGMFGMPREEASQKLWDNYRCRRLCTSSLAAA